MKIALQAAESEEAVKFIRQLGLRHVVSGLGAPPSGVLDVELLESRRDFFASHGLSWDVIENLPPDHYVDVMFGRPGRDRQIDNVCRTIENMARVGIGVLQYGWMLLGGIRTEYSPTGRGGARYPRFDLTVAERAPAAALDWLGLGKPRYPHIPDGELSAEQVWEHLIHFLEGVIPVAESVGVKLAAHPDDPPIPSYMGVARVLVSWDDLQRLIDAVPSPSNGLGFCMGTIATMAGMDTVAAIRHFGRQGKIHFAHFRNPRGQVPSFDEVFPDEGDIDMVAAVTAFDEVGFDGVIRIDHCPGVIGDSRADRSFAYQVGYLKGLVRARQLHTKEESGAMKLTLTVDYGYDEHLIFAQQLGTDAVVVSLAEWRADLLAGARNRVEQSGLTLAAVRLPDAASQELEALAAMIEAAGAASVEVLSCGLAVPQQHPGDAEPVGRGGTLVRRYGERGAPDRGALSALVTQALERLDPVAAGAGVRVAWRTGMPPALHLADFRRLLAEDRYPSMGLDVSLGGLVGADYLAALEEMLDSGRLWLVELNNLAGEGDARDAFLDEGAIDIPRVLRLLGRKGYGGVLRAGPAPGMLEDSEWGHKGRAFDLGFLRAVLQVVDGRPNQRT